jgi:hypothetical protein
MVFALSALRVFGSDASGPATRSTRMGRAGTQASRNGHDALVQFTALLDYGVDLLGMCQSLLRVVVAPGSEEERNWAERRSRADSMEGKPWLN